MESRIEDIVALTLNDVVQVYCGEQNTCMCGCSGTYSVNPKHIGLAARANGLTVKEQKADVNLVEVKRIFALFQEEAHLVTSMSSALFLDNDDEGRTYSLLTVEDMQRLAEFRAKAATAAKS